MLSDYRAHLARPSGGRALSPMTRVAYLRAATALLAFADGRGRPEPDARDVRRLLWRTLGARASLGPFLTWLEAERGLAIPLPRRAPRDAKAAERRLLASVSSLTSALEATSRPAAGRALLAGYASRSLGFPLERFLKLRWEDVCRDGPLQLRIDDLLVELPGRLAVHFDRIAGSRDQGLVFPGRSGQRPLSPGAILYHVGRVLRGSSPGRRRPRESRR